MTSTFRPAEEIAREMVADCMVSRTTGKHVVKLCQPGAIVYVDVALGEVDGQPRLLDTRTGEPWAGAFTPEEQAEADALLERARVMRRLDEQRWPRAA